MKVLVTGSGGYLGQHLIDRLLKEGHEVLALSRYKTDFKRSRLTFIQSDLNAINDAVSDLDIAAVFHTAAKINFDDSSESIAQITNDNILASMQLADFILKRGIKKVILSSTCSVYEENYNVNHWITESHKLRPWNLYAVSKLTSEWIFESKLSGKVENFVILRYSSIYGHKQRPGSIIPIFINNASLNKDLELFGSGKRIQDYVYIDDVVQANLNCLYRTLPYNCVFNIGSGEQITDEVLAKQIKTIWQSNSKILIKNMADKPDTYFNYSIVKANDLLGYYPSKLVDGLTRYRDKSFLS